MNADVGQSESKVNLFIGLVPVAIVVCIILLFVRGKDGKKLPVPQIFSLLALASGYMALIWHCIQYVKAYFEPEGFAWLFAFCLFPFAILIKPIVRLLNKIFGGPRLIPIGGRFGASPESAIFDRRCPECKGKFSSLFQANPVGMIYCKPEKLQVTCPSCGHFSNWHLDGVLMEESDDQQADDGPDGTNP